MKGKWQNVPGKWVDDSTAIDGKRFVASARGVQILRFRMSQERQGRCELCQHMGTDRHHVYGRGIGGGKTEDRPVVNGVKFVLWVCRKCHDLQVILPWGSWRDQQGVSGSALPSESTQQSLGPAVVPQCSLTVLLQDSGGWSSDS
jgi:hypothetical protein